VTPPPQSSRSAQQESARETREGDSQELPKPPYAVKATVFRTGFRNCQMARLTGLELFHNPSKKQCPE
jgi:hypothetical protein